MSNDVLALAYDAALASLREQDAMMTNLRNRASTLLAAAAVGTSFASTVGVMGSEPGAQVPFPVWVGWILVLLLVAIGVSVMIVLWPAPRWSFGPDPARLLKSANDDIDEVRRLATSALIEGIRANDRALAIRVHAYRVGACTLLVETVVLLLALVIN